MKENDLQQTVPEPAPLAISESLPRKHCQNTLVVAFSQGRDDKQWRVSNFLTFAIFETFFAVKLIKRRVDQPLWQDARKRARKGQHMRILAVDDDPIILELLEEVVQLVGPHTIKTATCATDALEYLADPDLERFDCFLLDIQMPGTDGIELCRILRDHPASRSAPILMLTAMSDKSYIDRAFAAGASDYITKPFELEDLRGRIGLMDSLISQRNNAPEEDNGLDRTGSAGEDDHTGKSKPPLHEPFAVRDVDGVIEHQALENYVSLLSRKELFGSTVFAYCIRGIQDLYESTCSFEYQCLITDVAEAIASSLEKQQFLVSHAGNGVFVCIVERGWQPNPATMADRVNLTLHQMELSYNDGKPMNVSVSLGDVVRLVWKSGDKAIDALANAYESAERESRRYARNLEDFWYDRHTA